MIYYIMKESLKLPYDVPEGCTMAFCPTCHRLFVRDETHQVCNDCSHGLVMTEEGMKYYPGLDQSKQKSFEE